MKTDPPSHPLPQPTQKDLSYPDIDDADAGGLTLADLDPDSVRPSEGREETPPKHDGPAEGPDIG